MILGAVAGDFYGSFYRNTKIKGYNLPLQCQANTFTLNTLLTIATADTVMNKSLEFDDAYQEAVVSHPGFDQKYSWTADPILILSNTLAAARISPFAFICSGPLEVIDCVSLGAPPQYSSLENIRSARAVGYALFLAKMKVPPMDILNEVSQAFRYPSTFDLAMESTRLITPRSPQELTPLAIFIGLTSKSFEDALRMCLRVGGDQSDMMSIAGAIAETIHGDIPDTLLVPVKNKLAEIFPDSHHYVSQYEDPSTTTNQA